MRLKQVIDSELGVRARITLGGPGVLDVFARGQLVFSHKATGVLPNADEIVRRLRELR